MCMLVSIRTKDSMRRRNSVFGSPYCTFFKVQMLYRHNAKRSFYRAANSILAKVGRVASEEVVIQLLKYKCIPILLYASDVCTLDKRSVQSLDFVVDRFCMKLFQTSNLEITQYCQTFFDLQLPSALIRNRYKNLLQVFESIRVS